MGKFDRNEAEQRLRNKIFAVEKQNKCFMDRLRTFNQATLWERLVMAWKGQI
jgi:hypothetical protein